MPFAVGSLSAATAGGDPNLGVRIRSYTATICRFVPTIVEIRPTISRFSKTCRPVYLLLLAIRILPRWLFNGFSPAKAEGIVPAA